MSKIPVTLLFSDGVTQKIEVEPGGKLLDAAAEAGWTLLTDCSNGQCGTCSGQCVSGRLDLDDYDPSVLPDDEREDGAVLCCVARVNEPAIVELPYESSEVGSGEPPTQQGTVVSVEKIAEETMRLEVEVAEPVSFLPGQYVRMRPEGQVEWRSYSMANETGQTRLVFFIRMVEGGVFSTWLSGAAPGSEIEVSAPRGSFFLRADARPRLFIAGGTGLAPFLAMLRAIRNGGYESAPTQLLVGVRSGAHLFARQELDAIKAEFPELQIHYAAEKDAPPGCHEGYGTDLIAGLGVDPKTQVYLCGPPPMVEAGREAIAKAGLRKSDALCERFA
ncbi:2Fe-2S iron-sulfur cluster binding domain-containing protein [Paraburkholderia sp. MPAMCS5]|uniref:2Fe-2S iron-sulfur cluster binding domain-containing protein n=1 Tax=Paraburkholderia sp. MPAMCS5 TaxID=3112563 RepID=UPI002E19B60F|nr:2Fe-2S iron-sulfur cluster binding domain-containing protein [Paraburkholderia sp. MPAMCS5]